MTSSDSTAPHAVASKGNKRLGVKEMSTVKTDQRSIHINQEKLLAFVRAMIGGSSGREDDEHPLPPGPYDPVIRIALEQINVFDPHPEPWKSAFAIILAKHPEIFDAIGSGRSFVSVDELIRNRCRRASLFWCRSHKR